MTFQSRRWQLVLLGLTLALLVGFDGPTTSAGQPKPAKFADVTKLVEQSRFDEALTALEGLPQTVRTEMRTQYLEARLLEALGREAEAADAFAVVLPRLPEFAVDGTRLRYARLLRNIGRCDQVYDILKPLIDRTTPSSEGRIIWARCALEHGDFDGALAKVRTLSEGSASAAQRDAMVVRIEAQIARGKLREADIDLKTLWAQAPTHPDVERLTQTLKESRAWTQPNAEHYADRARALLDARRYESVLETLDMKALKRMRKRTAQVQARWQYLRGMAYFRMRGADNYERASRELHQAAQVKGPQQGEAAFYAARALARAGKNQEAISAYRRVSQRFQKEELAAEAEYLRALLLRDESTAAGEQALKQFLASALAKRYSRFRIPATWELAFAALANERFAEAYELFQRYADEYKNSVEFARGAYWAARASEGAGERARAAELYRRVASHVAYHWYSTLAKQRLEQLGPIAPEPATQPAADADNDRRVAALTNSLNLDVHTRNVLNDATPTDEASSVRSDAAAGGSAGDDETGGAPLAATPSGFEPTATGLPTAVTFYAELGLMSDARQMLASMVGARRAGVGSVRDTRGLINAYRSLGDDMRAFHVAREELAREEPCPLNAENRWLWEAAYPRIYTDFVRRAAEQHGMPIGYLLGTIRQESGFNPLAVSVANARGLMQLITPTARTTANAAGIPFKPELLFDPEINIKLGAHHAASLVRSYSGQYILAIAAYNAGSFRIEQWLPRGTCRDTDEFVERIPIDETRNYVRRVVTHWLRYEVLTQGDVHTKLPQHLCL